MSNRPAPIQESSRNTPILGEYDVVVLGGGPAGIAAAAAAARTGRSTILIERYGFLGGAGTAAGLSTFCGLHANIHGEHKQVIHGLADEILGRLEKMGGLNTPHLSLANKITAQAYDISAYKIAADDLLVSSGVKVLFHAFGVGMAKRSDREIDALIVESKSGRAAIRGRMFIECSGDGDLAAWAGAPFELGDGAGNMLYPTTMFRIIGVDPVKAGRAWEIIPKLMEEAEKKGRRFPRKGAIVRPQKNPIEWRANLTQIKNPDGSPVSGIDVEQMSYGEIEGRRQCWDVFEFIKSVTPGFENAYIVEIAPQIGIRETRRVVGEYMLSESDILDMRELSGFHRRQRLARGGARVGQCRAQVPQDTRIARVQSAPVSNDRSKGNRQPVRRRPLRFHDSRRPVLGARLGSLLRHGPGFGNRRGPGIESGRAAARRRRKRPAAEAGIRWSLPGFGS